MINLSSDNLATNVEVPASGIVEKNNRAEVSSEVIDETMIQWDIEGMEETALLAQQEDDEAILDTGCTCELTGGKRFKENMSKADKQSIRSQGGPRPSQFGGGQNLKSFRKIQLISRGGRWSSSQML